jgi:hypothetical protein
VSACRGGRRQARLRHNLDRIGDEWAAQAANGPVRYDISFQPDQNRWYVDASWQAEAMRPPTLAELRQSRTIGVDLNAEHLACWVVDAFGNPVGPPHTIPLVLDALPASIRDGRLRAAITTILRLARRNGCRAIVIEDLDLTDARQTGRETFGHGRRARCFRRTISGIPTRRFRDYMAGMAANAGLWVIADDPGWTSKWGEHYWRTPLNQATKPSITVTRHHAAAVVIARRGQGVGARRRQGVTGRDQRIVAGELPARPDQRLPDCEGPGPPVGQRAAVAPQRTRPAERPTREPGGPRPFGTTGAGATSCSTPEERCQSVAAGSPPC